MTDKEDVAVVAVALTQIAGRLAEISENLEYITELFAQSTYELETDDDEEPRRVIRGRFVRTET